MWARDDDYYFDYVKVETLPPLSDLNDSGQDGFGNNQENLQNEFDQWDNNETQEDFNWDEPTDTVMPPAIPIWMQPEPQPELTGPLIRFDKVTFNFSTPYDSAFLTNTKGAVSLLDGSFVGEGEGLTGAPPGWPKTLFTLIFPLSTLMFQNLS